MLYGKNSFDPIHFHTSLVYGAVGEVMLNFGAAGVPVIYLFWTFLVARIRKWILTWDSRDIRLLLAPFLVNLCIAMLMGDSDNILYFVLKGGAVPVFLVWVASRHLSLRPLFIPPSANPRFQFSDGR